MIDLVFYFTCDESPVFNFVPPLDIPSVFFDLACEYVQLGKSPSLGSIRSRHDHLGDGAIDRLVKLYRGRGGALD